MELNQLSPPLKLQLLGIKIDNKSKSIITPAPKYSFALFQMTVDCNYLVP